MEQFNIVGGKRLNGAVKLHGAKNSALPILSSAILVKGVSVIHNCPDLSDVRETIGILRSLGCAVTFENNTIVIDSTNITDYRISETVMRQMRSSILFLGSLVSRCKQASIYLPGGCDIGSRPVDLHIRSLKALGVEIEENGSSIDCRTSGICGSKIILPFSSVGATENIIISTAISEGITTIINPAREPEICNLANFLNKCGAKIHGAGESVIEIEGVSELHSCEHTIISDRIVASTYMSACAITGGEIVIEDVVPTDLAPVFPAFSEMGCKLYLRDNYLKITAPQKLKRVRMIKTMAFPGFPTDSQSTIISDLAVARGTSVIKENIFENRFRFVSELNRFGADVEINDKLAVINGVRSLKGANVYATDLRGGAALVVAALRAEGTSTVNNLEYIDRGYEALEKNLSMLGADVKRINNETEEEKNK